ncbi:Zn-dependent protease [Virgibacillus natechei]|uniref:Zn-dependent protease n=1 Tax=Virgibacillus natechei TaxID=1216297 RepID=A0ABS4II39_9BACI|nr:site-2 protease family protein [Virgibacillus natechei]MBP1969654.1 Zn-dependent protease [Virgibacillus natechei]UZD11382.1 site-2 protease family protein [Virgibacillus natechei]
MDIYLLLYLIFIVAPLSTLLHEMGHAIAARVVNADNITFSIGLGKRINTFTFKEINFNIHAIFFLGGLAHNQRIVPYKKKEIIWISILGPVASGLFACLFYILYTIFPTNYWHLLFLFNIWLAFINSIPFNIKGKTSDGYLILKTILQKKSQFKIKKEK